MKVSVIIANILTFLIKFFKYTPTAKKTCFIRQFYFRAEKVIFLARNRLGALIILFFAHEIEKSRSACTVQTRLSFDKLYG